MAFSKTAVKSFAASVNEEGAKIFNVIFIVLVVAVGLVCGAACGAVAANDGARLLHAVKIIIKTRNIEIRVVFFIFSTSSSKIMIALFNPCYVFDFFLRSFLREIVLFT